MLFKKGFTLLSGGLGAPPPPKTLVNYVMKAIWIHSINDIKGLESGGVRVREK